MGGLTAAACILFLFIDMCVLGLTWIVYLIILTVKKKKNGDSKYWIPIVIILLLPFVILLLATLKIQNYNEKTPKLEISYYNKISEIPVLDDYTFYKI